MDKVGLVSAQLEYQPHYYIITCLWYFSHDAPGSPRACIIVFLFISIPHGTVRSKYSIGEERGLPDEERQ